MAENAEDPAIMLGIMFGLHVCTRCRALNLNKRHPGKQAGTVTTCNGEIHRRHPADRITLFLAET
jgi:hypothetical protein